MLNKTNGCKCHLLTQRQECRRGIDSRIIDSFQSRPKKRKVDRWTSCKIVTDGNFVLVSFQRMCRCFKMKHRNADAFWGETVKFFFSTFLHKFWLPNDKGFTKILTLETRFEFKLCLVVKWTTETRFAFKLFFFNHFLALFLSTFSFPLFLFHFSSQVLSSKWQSVCKDLWP